jgi:predicted nuclease with TOPRIM domain
MEIENTLAEVRQILQEIIKPYPANASLATLAGQVSNEVKRLRKEAENSRWMIKRLEDEIAQLDRKKLKELTEALLEELCEIHEVTTSRD